MLPELSGNDVEHSKDAPAPTTWDLLGFFPIYHLFHLCECLNFTVFSSPIISPICVNVVPLPNLWWGSYAPQQLK